MLIDRSAASPNRVHSLTGARFIAAFAVLVFHATSLGNFPSIVQRITSFGRCGVCFFFVLSGFVMTLNYCQTFGRIRFDDYRRFFLSRLIRIAPAHVATLLLITPLAIYLNQRASLVASSSFVVPAGMAVRSWLANLFLVQIYNPRIEFEQMYNAPSWSVACEVVFYLLFPFLICLLQRRAASLRRLFAIAGAIWLVEVAAVAIAIHLLRSAKGNVDEKTFDFLIGRCPLIRLAEFAVGCCGGLIFLQRSALESKTTANQWLLISLGLLAGGLACFGAFPHFKLTYWCLAITPAALVGIIGLSGERHVLKQFLESKTMLLLGESSYALYLLQWTVILFFRQKRFLGMPGIAVVAVLGGCVAASLLLHLYLEVPVCKFLRRRCLGTSRSLAKTTTEFPAAQHAVISLPLAQNQF
jgi:peptidoglycan/LPS O-acetylase OafA/YrhL